jgi:hypothetical protein
MGGVGLGKSLSRAGMLKKERNGGSSSASLDTFS